MECFTPLNISQNTNNTSSSNELMQNIDDKIKSVESKLSTANEESRPALKAQLTGLQAQKLAVLAREIT